MSYLKNHFAVLDGGNDWHEVKKRKPHRSKKNVPTRLVPKKANLPKNVVSLNHKKLFSDQMLKEYSRRFKESDIVNVCDDLMSEVSEVFMKNSANRDQLKKQLFTKLGFLEQKALFSSLTASQAKEEKILEPVVEPEIPDEVPENPKEVEEEDEVYQEALVQDDLTERVEALEEIDEDEEEEKEDSESKVEYEVEKDVVPEDVEENESTGEEEGLGDPTLSVGQKLGEQAKLLDLSSVHACKVIAEWSRCIQQDGDLGKEFRAAFNQSNVLRTLIKAMLIVSSNEQIRSKEEIVDLFHAILQGNNEYHVWLYNQIRKLANNISKTSRRTNTEWFTFLSNQAFALVDAQKDRKINPLPNNPPPVYHLPSTYATVEKDEWLKMQWEWADTHYTDMYRSVTELQTKDEEILMNPMSSTSFQQRYTQVQNHLDQHISRAQAHVTAQKSRLDKISENLEVNERRMKKLINPMEQQLHDAQNRAEQAENEILEYETRLKAARAQLAEIRTSESQLKNRISEVQKTHFPQREELLKQRTNSQFKLIDANLEQDCYTQLRHIALESYKHLDSWTQCNMRQESDSRRVLLEKFYDCVDKYACTLIPMLHFLEQRVGYMKEALERNQNEANRRKHIHGVSYTKMEGRIRADRKKLQVDSELILKLQNEVDSMVQKSLSAVMNWRGFEHIFNVLWQKIEAVSSRHQVDINSFVKLNFPQSIGSHPQQMNNGLANSQLPLYNQHSQHITGASGEGQHLVSAFSGHSAQGVQSQTQNLQRRQYSKPAVSQAVNQSSSHLTQISQPVSETHNQQVSQTARTSPHGSQQPLKIINNTTDKNFDLQQNVGGHYQNKVRAEGSSAPRPTKPPVTKNYKSSASSSLTVHTPPQGVENTVYNMRRPPSPTTQPPSQAVEKPVHGYGRSRSTASTSRTLHAKSPTNYWERQRN